MTEDEAYKLYDVFSKITSSDAGEVMLFDEFCSVFDFSPTSMIVQRIFDTFDAYRVKAVNFAQFALVFILVNIFFIQGVAILSSKCPALSLARCITLAYNFFYLVTFDIYDLDKNGVIDYFELKSMLENSLRDRGLNYSEEDIKHICRNTLKLLDSDKRGYIAYESYVRV